jgi:two-component system chemotaxis response regulator CheB
MVAPAGPIRVLVVDDSATARDLISALIAVDPRLTVCGQAEDGRDAVRQAQALRPDLVTMDLRMPEMDGLEAIVEIMDQCATRILVVSDAADAANAMAAVARGALDATFKPDLDEGPAFTARLRMLAGVPVIRHLRGLAEARPAPRDLAPSASADRPGTRLIAIAVSTGGPQALARLLPALPAGLQAPVLIAQHISDGFAQGMAQWLDTLCTLRVAVARDGEALLPGRVYIADPATHLTLAPGNLIHLSPREPGDIYRPSCDRLLNSVATAGPLAIGVILTGMGRDGAQGIATIAAAGGTTLAQDEASSVVFGMNREAILAGGVQRVLPLDAIAGELTRLAGVAPSPVIKRAGGASA